MSEPESAPEARRWALREDEPAPAPACFHAQQAAEKALKAALVLESIEFPYVHDLRRLRDLLPDTWPVGLSPTALQRLTEWGAESRYPGDWPDLTVEDAERAQAEARAVHDPVADEFRRRGVSVE